MPHHHAAGAALAHAIPGRFRLRIDAAKGNAPLAVELAERLADAPDVVHVEPNASTGSIVVRYAPAHADWVHQTREISRRIAPLVPGLDVNALVPHERRHAHPAHPPQHHVKSFFHDLNDGVASTTGGFDLSFLLPAALVVLGVGSFFGSERVPVPRWYDLLWFGFGTFMMLNAAGVPPAKAAEEAAELAASL